jgi:glucose-1-phosphate thymidylyltransferase
MHTPSRVHLTFAVQEAARGTADAVLSAQAFCGRDPFLVLNADNLYPAILFRLLTEVEGMALPVFRASALVRDSNIPPERIKSFGLLDVSARNELVDIVEKPAPDVLAAFGPDPFVSMNCWRFDSRIFDACAEVPPSARGELELPEAVRHAIKQHGVRFTAIPIDNGAVIDLSERGDVAEVERRLVAIEPRP